MRNYNDTEEFGEENCPGQKVFYKEPQWGGEGRCEEIISEDEIWIHSGEKWGPFPIKMEVCSGQTMASSVKRKALQF